MSDVLRLHVQLLAASWRWSQSAITVADKHLFENLFKFYSYSYKQTFLDLLWKSFRNASAIPLFTRFFRRNLLP